MADSIFRHLVGDGRGPHVASAVRAGNEITVTLEGGVAPMTGHADHAGWYVTDDGAPIAITSAAGAGMQVVLTLASVPAGEVGLSYARAGAAEGTALLDSGMFPATVEPVYDYPVTGS